MSGSPVSIIQARMSSQRLPGKVLKPLGTRTVLGQVVHRTRAFSSQVVVCTSTDPDDDAVEKECRELGVLCVRGSRDNVFSRYRRTLTHPDVEASTYFARVTADCPLVSPTLAKQVIAAAGEDVAYASMDQDLLPRGLSIEVIRRDVFEGIDVDTLDAPEQEHVTLHFYENAERFPCVYPTPDARLAAPEFRLTLDYEEDYALLRALFARDTDVSAEQAITWLRQEPALAMLNAQCEQRAARRER